MMQLWLVLLCVGVALIVSGLWLRNRALARELEQERSYRKP